MKLKYDLNVLDGEEVAYLLKTSYYQDIIKNIIVINVPGRRKQSLEIELSKELNPNELLELGASLAYIDSDM